MIEISLLKEVKEKIENHTKNLKDMSKMLQWTNKNEEKKTFEFA